MEFVNNEYRNDRGIYQIENLENGFIYIGQTKESFERRYWHHCFLLKHGKHHNIALQQDWDKYGADRFIFKALFITDDNLDDLEVKCIEQARNNGDCYNIQNGGPGFDGCVISQETRQRIGNLNRQRMLGTKLSDETRAKMRASSRHRPITEREKENLRIMRTGFVVSDETKQKLRELNIGSKSPVARLDENKVFEIKTAILSGATQKEMSQKYNVSYGTISAIYHNRTWTHVKVDGWDNKNNVT